MTSPATEIASRPPLRVPQELLARPGFLLAKLGAAVKGRALAAFEREGFDGYPYSALALLGGGERETRGTTADALGLARSQLVGVLDALEEGVLIGGRRAPQDRRRHVVSLTAEGRRQLVE